MTLANQPPPKRRCTTAPQRQFYSFHLSCHDPIPMSQRQEMTTAQNSAEISSPPPPCQVTSLLLYLVLRKSSDTYLDREKQEVETEYILKKMKMPPIYIANEFSQVCHSLLKSHPMPLIRSHNPPAPRKTWVAVLAPTVCSAQTLSLLSPDVHYSILH